LKLFLDNNLPPSLAKALDALIAPTHQAIHLRDKFPPHTPDIEWIAVLKRESDWAILSQDQFRESAAERKALAESGLVVYWLSGKQWNKLPSLEKNLAVLEWTREILEHAEHAIREAQQTGKGSAWSIKYVANNRKRSFVKENLN